MVGGPEMGAPADSSSMQEGRLVERWSSMVLMSRRMERGRG